MSDDRKPIVIVPLANGYAVMPYTLNTVMCMQDGAKEIYCALDIEKLQEVIREIYTPPIVPNDKETDR